MVCGAVDADAYETFLRQGLVMDDESSWGVHKIEYINTLKMDLTTLFISFIPSHYSSTTP